MTSYRDKKSLTRLPGCVELGLLAPLLVLAVGTTELRAAPVVEPMPQTQNLENGDYLEAKQLLKNRKWPEAVIILRTLLRRSPDFPLVAMDLARALVYSGRREEALSVLAQTLARQKGDTQKALVAKSKVLSRMFLTNASFQLYQDGINLMLSKKYRAARDKLDKALEQEPDNVEILTRSGQCLVLEADYDSAAERLRLAKRLNPYEPEIRLWLGRALHQRGELSEAMEELKTAAQELRTDETGWIWYAEATVASGLKNGGIAALEADLKNQPLHVQALILLARYRLNVAGKDTQVLWNVRKDLQLALSRLEEYQPDTSPTSGDLGLRLPIAKEDLRTDIEQLMNQVEARLADPMNRGETTAN